MKLQIKRAPRGKCNWSMQLRNLEDLRAELQQLEEIEKCLENDSDRVRFMFLRPIFREQVLDEIRWAERVERRPWIRPFYVVFWWGLLAATILGACYSVLFQ